MAENPCTVKVHLNSQQKASALWIMEHRGFPDLAALCQRGVEHYLFSHTQRAILKQEEPGSPRLQELQKHFDRLRPLIEVEHE